MQFKRDINGSYIFRSLPVADLMFGIPKDWFIISFAFYVICYDVGYQMVGLLLYITALTVGWLLARFYDPYFSDIFVAKITYFAPICIKKTYNY